MAAKPPSFGHNRLVFAGVLFAGVVVAFNLVITSQFVWRIHRVLKAQQKSDLTLPVEKPERRMETEQTTITVKGDDFLALDGHQIQQSELLGLLQNFDAKGVRIVASRDVKYPHLKEIMKICGSAGVGRVTFTVLDDRKATPGTTPGVSTGN